MGIYRFVLSIMVALSHSGIFYWGVNQGTVAVISFLILTGYTSEISVSKMRGQTGEDRNILKYYWNRIIRLFPLYWFWVIVTLFVVYFGMVHETIHVISLKGTVLNLMLLPLNFTFLSTGLHTAMDACRVIPAAWTMGVQLTYYIAAPFLHVFREKKNYINILLFTVSLLLYVLTLRGNLSPVWGYGLLPGMLWIFIMGIYLYKDGVKEKRILYGMYSVIFLLFLYMGSTGKLINGQSKEILLGVVLGLPLIYFLKSFERGKIDSFLGSISYGIYLCHFTVKTVIQNVIGHQPGNFREWLIFIVLSILCATVSHFIVEYPIEKLRHRKRTVIV